MENNNAINSSLNEIVKEALNTDFEPYNDEDWTKIQPKLSSASSSFNPLNKFDAEAIIKHYIKEHKSTIIYISIAVALVLIVIGISYNSNPSAELTPEIPENETAEKIITKVDSVRGADTLKTISTSVITKKQIVDSSKLITPKAVIPAPTPSIASETKSPKEPESKKETAREKEVQKASKKKKEDSLKNIEEIELTAPKPTINVVKKKKAKDSTDNTQPKPVQQATPSATPVEKNKVTAPEETKTTTEEKKEEENSEKKKRRIKRKKEEIPDDQKPKTFQEVFE